jgi:hypothetical protein
MVYLTDMADVLRRAGLKVVEIPGWKTRGRPGDFAPIGVLCHHTGSANTGPDKEYGYANWLAVTGRSDLSAPLAQLALGRTGIFYVLAAGRANHAGRCKLVAGLQPSFAGATYGDGNEQLVGIEAMNDGIGEPWPRVQYDAYVRGCAALNAAYGYPVRRTLGHKETSLSGKPDPVGIDMTTFRADVTAAPTTTVKDWFDMATQADLEKALTNVLMNNADVKREIARYVWTGYPVGPAGEQKVASAQLGLLEQLSRLSILADSDDVTAGDIKAAMAEAVASSMKVEGDVRLVPKETPTTPTEVQQ